MADRDIDCLEELLAFQVHDKHENGGHGYSHDEHELEVANPMQP
jgi:hypothetical protein